MITVVARSRCALCGYLLSSLAFPSVRVNRRSIRQLPGAYLWCAPPGCPECNTSTFGSGVYAPLARESYTASPWRPDAKSWAEIEAYRAERWPG